MKRLICLFVVAFAFCAMAIAQETEKLTSVEQLQYQRLTLDQSVAQNAIDMWVAQNPELQELINKRREVTGKIAEFQSAIFKSHGKDQKEWSFSPQNLALVKKAPEKK